MTGSFDSRRSSAARMVTVIVAAALLLATPPRHAAAAEPATDPPARPLLDLTRGPVTIVCLGDSVTGVYYHTGGRRAYPEMLEIAIRRAVPKSQARVINAGISGHSTTEGLKRLDSDVLQHKPQLVTISFGLNDMTRLSEEQYRENLTTLVTRCQVAQAQVVLCTPNTVITTSGRPLEKLQRFCAVLREVAEATHVPVCDQFAAGEALRAKDAWAWRLTLSDAIHPNMDGHKLMAEELCRTITGQRVSLADERPPADFLAVTRKRVAEGRPVKVLAMPPLDTLIGPALQKTLPSAQVEVTAWPTEGRSLAQLEEDAKQRVRAMKPDLVVLAVPPTASAAADEAFVNSYAWVMNWSLSFGQQEWDCVVVHPAVAWPQAAVPQAALIRQLVRAQHLVLVDRPAGDAATAENLVARTLAESKGIGAGEPK